MVLTGTLDDGTAGLLAVKRCGGVAVVQNPDDAAWPDMPRHAMRKVTVDFCLRYERRDTVNYYEVHCIRTH